MIAQLKLSFIRQKSYQLNRVMMCYTLRVCLCPLTHQP